MTNDIPSSGLGQQEFSSRPPKPTLWFAFGSLTGILLVITLNSTSYFNLSDSSLDLIQLGNTAKESIGFPFAWWTENSDKKLDLLNLKIAGATALGVGLISGLLFFQVGRLVCINDSLANPKDGENRQQPSDAGLFQVSLRGILLLTTAIALIFFVMNYWQAIKRVPVQSSNIVSVGYRSTTATLEIEFKNRSVYQYYNVPAKIHAELMQAESHGKYVHKHVISGKYEFRGIQYAESPWLAVMYFIGPIFAFSIAMLSGGLARRGRALVFVATLALLVSLLLFTPLRGYVAGDRGGIIIQGGPEFTNSRLLLGFLVFWSPQIFVITLLWWLAGIHSLTRAAISRSRAT